MQKRYLLPILLLVAGMVSFAFPPLFSILLILTSPAVLSVLTISEALGGPRDTMVPAVILSFVQFFLIGLAWDKIEQKIRSRAGKLD